MKPEVYGFFDEATFTITYVVRDPNSKKCAIVDSVLDFDYASWRTDTRSADAVIAFVQDKGFEVEWLLESHVHADHLSAAPYLQEKLGGKIGIGENITVVQNTFGKVFNEGTEFQRDGSQFDRLFGDGASQRKTRGKIGREPRLDAGLCQAFRQMKHIGRTAAGDGRDRIDQRLVLHPLHRAHGGQQSVAFVSLSSADMRIGHTDGYPGPDRCGRVGHRPDHRALRRQGAREAFQSAPCGDREYDRARTD